MQVWNYELTKFMEGADKRFVIPVYQRNYNWKIENCKQLFDDLVRVIRNNRPNHFFGSIVAATERGELLIIDGQQRLTTVTLLLLALYNLIRQGKITPEDKQLERRIYEEYLVDKYQPKETRLKLKPIKNDRAAFGKLFDDPADYIQASTLTANYTFFYERIQKGELSPDELFRAIRSLIIVYICLDRDDNPQLIFESLNSTGLDLSEGDKVRNFILMGLAPRRQEECYEKYWNKIEENTGYHVDAFVRDYLSVKQRSIAAMNRIYFRFKEYVQDSGLETEELLADLLNYSRLYRVLLTGDHPDRRLGACIYRLNRLETTVTRPFLVELLRLNQEGNLSQNDLAEAFLLTESYLFRRMICDLATNALNKLFVGLHHEIMRFDGTPENYLEKMKFALASRRDRVRFPDDREFVEAMAHRQIYQMPSRARVYVFERLENYGTLEDKDIYRHIDDGSYSIEHIMPQHLTQTWIKDLGEDYERIYEEWLHRLANLTITAYNSKYSNFPFSDKRDMEGGFRDSGIRMNQWIASKEKWGEQELQERSELLKKRSLVIWAFPHTDYRPAEKQAETLTLADDADDLTGRKITRFVFAKVEQPVKSWIEMYESVIRTLYSFDKSIILQLADADRQTSGLSYYFSRNSADLRQAIEIDKGLYIEGNTATETKLMVLRKLFDLYGNNPYDLTFFLGNDDEHAEDDGGGQPSRFALRRRYWEFALKFIKAKMDGKAFSNSSPTGDNWMHAGFGISGFSLCCVANFDSARTMLKLDRGDEKENKRAFDELVQYKAKIEASLGVPLVWRRGEGKKRSIIYYQLEGVGIAKESDWERVANFHAEWSEKFYRELVVAYLLPLYGKKG